MISYAETHIETPFLLKGLVKDGLTQVIYLISLSIQWQRRMKEI